MTAETGKTASRAGKAYLGRIAVGWLAGGFALTLAVAGGIGLSAQGIAEHNSRAPIAVDAGRIVAEGRSDRISFSGGVTVTQAGLTVSAQRMLLNYSDDGGLDIQRITANGGVSVSRGNESASGDVAIYDLNRRIITMAGNVRLRRGNDTLNGGRLVIDLRSGVSSIDGRASGGASVSGSESGRVTGTFSVPQGKDEDE